MSSNTANIAQAETEFDEEWYLRAYPDIAKAVNEGAVPSGFIHYTNIGHAEGRLAAAFDPTWYARTYPLAVHELETTEPGALQRHYQRTGRHRGYLASPSARRQKNAANMSSQFGGLWIDNANAEDLVVGKYEIGQIGSDDASALKGYIKDGYFRASGKIPPVYLDRAEEALENAYAGKMEGLLFECHSLSRSHCSWLPGVKEKRAKALDLHWWSEDIRNLVLCDAAKHFLGLIFERPPLVSQTLGFYRGSGQPLHQDSAYVGYTLPLQFSASWIALEDVMAGAGELEYLVGSHRALPEYTYPGGFKSVSESSRCGNDSTEASKAVEKHEKQIAIEGRRRGLKREPFIAKRGDILFWHADLAHGGSPISMDRSRKSVVTHYCPREIAPLYFENGSSSVCKHGSGAYYTSALYRDSTPDR